MRFPSQLTPMVHAMLCVSVLTHYLVLNPSKRRYAAEIAYLFGSPFGLTEEVELYGGARGGGKIPKELL